MGTRADFYVGRGEKAEWLGSIAWDGYPDGIDQDVFKATDESSYREQVSSYLKSREDGTEPKDGWPWPWKDSRTTDYAYAFDDGAVWGACFGKRWFRIDLSVLNLGEPDYEDEDGEDGCVFPDMTAVQDVTFGKRSGVIIFSVPK
jgi:hypothetical protein